MEDAFLRERNLFGLCACAD